MEFLRSNYSWLLDMYICTNGAYCWFTYIRLRGVSRKKERQQKIPWSFEKPFEHITVRTPLLKQSRNEPKRYREWGTLIFLNFLNRLFKRSSESCHAFERHFKWPEKNETCRKRVINEFFIYHCWQYWEPLWFSRLEEGDKQTTLSSFSKQTISTLTTDATGVLVSPPCKYVSRMYNQEDNGFCYLLIIWFCNLKILPCAWVYYFPSLGANYVISVRLQIL